MTHTIQMKRRMTKLTRKLRDEDRANVAECSGARPFVIVVCLMTY